MRYICNYIILNYLAMNVKYIYICKCIYISSLYIQYKYLYASVLILL